MHRRVDFELERWTVNNVVDPHNTRVFFCGESELCGWNFGSPENEDFASRLHSRFSAFLFPSCHVSGYHSVWCNSLLWCRGETRERESTALNPLGNEGGPQSSRESSSREVETRRKTTHTTTQKDISGTTVSVGREKRDATCYETNFD